MGLFRKIADECFSCHKKLESEDSEWSDKKHIIHFGYKPPKRMSNHDRLCRSCLENIKNTQEVQLEGKYVRELPIRRNIIGSYIPVWTLVVAMNLGWRYGTLSVLTHLLVLYGLIIVGVVLLHDVSDTISLLNILGLIMIFSSFPLNGLITWYFIKKHNARVKVNKSNLSPN